MRQREFLAKLVLELTEAGIPYMLSGSMGSSLHGEPRATNDIDLLIAPSEKQLDLFVQSFQEGYYISHEAAREALRESTMFNIVDHQTGWKADFIIVKPRPYSQEEFRRK